MELVEIALIVVAATTTMITLANGQATPDCQTNLTVCNDIKTQANLQKCCRSSLTWLAKDLPCLCYGFELAELNETEAINWLETSCNIRLGNTSSLCTPGAPIPTFTPGPALPPSNDESGSYFSSSSSDLPPAQNPKVGEAAPSFPPDPESPPSPPSEATPSGSPLGSMTPAESPFSYGTISDDNGASKVNAFTRVSFLISSAFLFLFIL